jgi:Lipid A 3-O-deacylase (PagL)
LVLASPGKVRAAEDDLFAKDAVIISAEGGFNHFGPRLATNGYLQTWNFGARLSLLPFAPFRPALLGHILDGSLETGLEPVYVRFASQNQNYGGLGLDFRYHLIGLSFGPFVPWINWMGGAGGTDVQVAGLSGPFMFIMRAGAGVEYFVSERSAVYLGYQYTHFSNGGTESSNNSLNSPGGALLGVSFFLPHSR